MSNGILSVETMLKGELAGLTQRVAAVQAALAALDVNEAPAKPKRGRPKTKRGPGRPKGSKNKTSTTAKRGPGRPKGSKNKASATAKRGPGRPKGSKNKTSTVPPPVTVSAESSGRRGRPVSENSLRAVMARVMASKPQGMTIAEIAEAVQAAGKTSKSKTFVKQVNAALITGDEFTAVRRGVYTLAGSTPSPAPAVVTETIPAPAVETQSEPIEPQAETPADLVTAIDSI